MSVSSKASATRPTSHFSKPSPCAGVSLLDIPSQLGVIVVDRLLGGPAQAVNLERDLSEIEGALLDQAVQIILNEWCNQWSQPARAAASGGGP